MWRTYKQVNMHKKAQMAERFYNKVEKWKKKCVNAKSN